MVVNATYPVVKVCPRAVFSQIDRRANYHGGNYAEQAAGGKKSLDGESVRDHSSDHIADSGLAPAAEKAAVGIDQFAGGPLAGRGELLGGLLLVLAASCAVFFSGLGNAPLFNPDEALYAEPAREMLVTGEWITTLLNYVVRFTKPPLCIWAMALSYEAFGVNEFAARFFGVACATVLVSIVYLTIARYVSVRTAVIGALSLVLAPLFALTAREAITDMPLALFMAASQLAFFHAFKQKRFAFALAGYVLLALAIMTKGPVGIVLPLAILFVYHFLRGEIGAAWRFYKPLTGAVVVSILALPWFVVEINVTKGAYFQEFIVRENFQRFTAVVDNHKQPFYYHFLAMVGGYFPFSLYLPQIIASFAIKLKRVLTGVVGPLAMLKELRSVLLAQNEGEDLAFYSLLWAFAVLIFFSLSVSKLLPYTLPAFPAMAILVAIELESAFISASFKRLAFPLMAAMFIYGGAGLLTPKLLHKSRHAPQGLEALIVGFTSFQAMVTLIALLLLRLRRYCAAITFFSIFALVLLSVYLNLALPKVAAKLEGDLPAYCNFAGQSKLPIIVFDMRKPGAPFYALRQVLNVNGGDELKAVLAKLPAAYILTKSEKLEFLKTIEGTRVINQKDDYAIVQFTAR